MTSRGVFDMDLSMVYYRVNKIIYDMKEHNCLVSKKYLISGGWYRGDFYNEQNRILQLQAAINRMLHHYDRYKFTHEGMDGSICTREESEEDARRSLDVISKLNIGDEPLKSELNEQLLRFVDLMVNAPLTAKKHMKDGIKKYWELKGKKYSDDLIDKAVELAAKTNASNASREFKMSQGMVVYYLKRRGYVCITHGNNKSVKWVLSEGLM